LDKEIMASIPFSKWVYASFVVNLVVILLVLAIQKWLPPQVPLFYGMAEGEGQLAKSILLPLPSLAAIGITVANILISLSIKDLFIKKALIVAGLGVTFLATITIVKIVFLLGSF
jgi:hypothetical protein